MDASNETYIGLSKSADITFYELIQVECDPMKDITPREIINAIAVLDKESFQGRSRIDVGLHGLTWFCSTMGFLPGFLGNQPTARINNAGYEFFERMEKVQGAADVVRGGESAMRECIGYIKSITIVGPATLSRVFITFKNLLILGILMKNVMLVGTAGKAMLTFLERE